MTKIVPIVLTKYQTQIFNSTSRVSLVTGAFGIGNSYGLLIKAFKEAAEGKLVTYFRQHSTQIQKAGGVFDEAAKLAEIFNARVSTKSQIISVGDGKIKFIGAERPLEDSVGISPDLVIMEHCIPEEVIKYHLMRSKQIMIREGFHEIETCNSDHWLQKFGLVEADENGKATRIADWVEHITAGWEDAYPWEGSDKYRKIFETSNNPDVIKLIRYNF